MKNGSHNSRNGKGQFAPGNNGGPGRRPGSRQRLTERFLTDLEKDWRQHGKEAITLARETEPMQYCAMIAKLLPKHIDAKVEHEISESFRTALMAANCARPVPRRLGETIDGTGGEVNVATLLQINGGKAS